MNGLTALAQSERVPSAFEDWWQTRGEWVEAPNRRRGGESGVQRLRHATGPSLYLKRQTGHLYRSWRHPWGRPTVLRELHAMQALEKLAIRVPKLVYGAAQKHAGQWRALLVTEALEGFVSLEQWYASEAPQRWGHGFQGRLLQELALTLRRLHRAGWQHGCLYPKHIFVKRHAAGSSDWAEVALLDLEKSRRRLFGSAAARRDLAQLSRRRGDMPSADWRTLLDAYAACDGSTDSVAASQREA
ncbi:lipopolysaccharide kinase InaA family protein [Pseudomonas sp. sp1636]|uniref:lipopolysaccharide kinase InaA family protein n=1 Tax=Pseudomonas sp. sp1636 TaxID=3036707 RepID=UPI0025A5009B|nr:lipopolysaccharide kinase InaA family protein [Pseudomonas sp. sp1636]MDM8347538.1 lipopolysaccharide kinase InaA family protein [Pseudomonas sp. sp1636]